MDPFTIALATFGVQKLRGKSTKRALRDAAIVGGASYGFGQLSAAGKIPGVTAGQGIGRIGQGPMFSGLGFGQTASANQAAVQAAEASGNIPASITQTGQMTSLPASEFADAADGITSYADTDLVPRITPGKVKSGKSAITGFGAETGAGESRDQILKAAMKDESVMNISDKTQPSGILAAAKEQYNKLTGPQKFVGATVGIPLVTSLFSDDEDPKPPFTDEDYEKAYKKASEKLGDGFAPIESQEVPMSDVFASRDIYNFNSGGIASINKFNEGGVNYLPSKSDHNENDPTNYVRATGYVEDGSGNGDKDEDTMLAQLADGEFVSRADAVLGAGILSGGDPKSYKSMRKAGADFFYDQQKKFKRIFDLVNASTETKN
jgi:hypothetical protein